MRLIGKLKDENTNNSSVIQTLKSDSALFLYENKQPLYLKLQFHLKCSDSDKDMYMNKYLQFCEYLYEGTDIVSAGVI